MEKWCFSVGRSAKTSALKQRRRRPKNNFLIQCARPLPPLLSFVLYSSSLFWPQICASASPLIPLIISSSSSQFVHLCFGAISAQLYSIIGRFDCVQPGNNGERGDQRAKCRGNSCVFKEIQRCRISPLEITWSLQNKEEQIQTPPPTFFDVFFQVCLAFIFPPE